MFQVSCRKYYLLCMGDEQINDSTSYKSLQCERLKSA